MGQVVSSLVGGGTSMLGQGIQGRAKEKALELGGKISFLAYDYQARVDQTNADIIKAQTKRDVVTIRKEGEKEISEQSARIGASGLTRESFGLLTAEGLDTLEKDIEDFQLTKDVEVFGLESSARFKRLQGQAAMAGASVEAQATKVGTAFSIIGTGMSSAGKATGGK